MQRKLKVKIEYVKRYVSGKYKIVKRAKFIPRLNCFVCRILCVCVSIKQEREDREKEKGRKNENVRAYE